MENLFLRKKDYIMYYLVQGDTASQLQSTLVRNDTGDVVDLTDHAVNLKVRERNSITVLFTVLGTSTTQEALEGKVNFQFYNDLDTLDGFYEGEIEITYDNTLVESVYELLPFRVRVDF
jgi:hypothetical protein